jgi:hypothetical protein
MRNEAQILEDVRAAGREMWGQVNSATPVHGVPGVYFVDTAGHGGYIVALEAHPLPATIASWDTVVAAPGSRQRFAAFEEDCDWAALLYFDEVVRAGEEAGASADYKGQYGRERLRTLVEVYHPELLAVAG